VTSDINESNAVDDSENNWFLPQVNFMENATNLTNAPTSLTNSPKYGFANKVSGALTAFEVHLYNLF